MRLAACCMHLILVYNDEPLFGVLNWVRHTSNLTDWCKSTGWHRFKPIKSGELCCLSAGQSLEEVEAVPCQGPEGQEGCQKGPGVLDRPCFCCLAGSHAQAAPSEGTCKKERLQTSAEVGPLPTRRVTFPGGFDS